MDHDRTVALVSGATGVTGNVIAKELAATPGYEVARLARNESRAKMAVDQIRRDTGNDAVRFIVADVPRHQSVQAAATNWHGPLHVLVNNVGIAPRKRETTPDDIELTFATNVLGYIWVTQAFRSCARCQCSQLLCRRFGSRRSRIQTPSVRQPSCIPAVQTSQSHDHSAAGCGICRRRNNSELLPPRQPFVGVEPQPWLWRLSISR